MELPKNLKDQKSIIFVLSEILKLTYEYTR